MTFESRIYLQCGGQPGTKQQPAKERASKPFSVRLDVNHRNRSAELQLRDELKQKCRRRFALADKLEVCCFRIEEKVAVRGHAANVEASLFNISL